MSFVEMAVELPGKGLGGAPGGAGGSWYGDDRPAAVDPVRDLRLVQPDEPLWSPELIESIVAQASEALTLLQRIAADDQEALEPTTVESLATGIEQLRRQADAASTECTRRIDRTEPFRADGWFTAKRWLKHRLQLSGSEAFCRVQAARLADRAPRWAVAAGAGQVGVAQVRVMAQIAANPRIPVDVFEVGARELLVDAMTLPFDEFERLARTWELLADPIGAAEARERASERRHAIVRARPDGGFDIDAVLDDIGGSELLETFAWYVDAEFRSDWDEATARLGTDEVAMSDLRRTQAQRTADALVAMARAAAAAPPGRRDPLPTVNLLIDHDTYRDTVSGVPINPARFRDVLCRTERGHRLHPADVVDTSLWAYIRRVVVGAAGVTIDLARRSRLFVGPSREAVMLLEPQCVWTGCDRPARSCEADHLDPWRARGPTSPDNGAPLCRRHNRLKETGFRVQRDGEGGWHVHHPDGHEVL